MTEKDITIKGKTTSQYLASVVVDNLPPRPLYPDAQDDAGQPTDQLQNKTLWSSYTKYRCETVLPEHGTVGVQVDSDSSAASR
ncbi:hypothetical protein [Escherichia coli]|uniref:hypothetical protein n=1 Tax=Escherichia coli TaxID=562 RepID=UPI0002C900E5|nr:putative phage tail fiber protein [Escherichia coli P0304777.8]